MRKIISVFLMAIILGALQSCGIQSIPESLNEVEAQWAEVQNQYKRRSDLIPNLVQTVKGYASHEEETLTAVIAARAKATQVQLKVEDLSEENLKKYQQAQQGLSGALSRLMMVSEKYPDLKANQNFIDLSHQLEGTENRISVARNRYIEAIKRFNNLVTVPPSSFANSIFYHHSKKPQFQVDNLEQVEKAPEVNFDGK